VILAVLSAMPSKPGTIFCFSVLFLNTFGNCCSVGGMNWFPGNMAELIDQVATTSQKEARIILLGASAIFWAIWLIRNKIIFGKKLATNRKEIVSQVSSLRSWAALQKQDDKECVLGFVARLKDAALKILSYLNTSAEWWNI
jgi:hypothetical protein